jgi:hypothetical protein
MCASAFFLLCQPHPVLPQALFYQGKTITVIVPNLADENEALSSETLDFGTKIMSLPRCSLVRP